MMTSVEPKLDTNKRCQSRIYILIVLIVLAVLFLFVIVGLVVYLCVFAKFANTRTVSSNVSNSSNQTNSANKTILAENAIVSNIVEQSPTIHANTCGRPKIKPLLDQDTRIINGYASVPHSLPWMVSIGYTGPLTSYAHVCGGSLINERFVLTAAHCVFAQTIYALVGQPGPNDSVESMGRIYLGVYDDNTDRRPENTYRIKNIFTHPKYNDKSENMVNDLALIELTSNANLSDNIQIICLNRAIGLSKKTAVYAAGWGLTQDFVYSKLLMQVKLYVLDLSKCSEWRLDVKSQICAGSIGYSTRPKDTCSGDSGSPLMFYDKPSGQWFLVGIVSYGDYPCNGIGVYTNVKFYYDWIVSHLN